MCWYALMCTSSEEDGTVQGLGWFPEKIKKLNSSNSERVPHVGWNEVVFKNALLGFSENSYAHFYFDHSFAYISKEGTESKGTCDYSEGFSGDMQRKYNRGAVSSRKSQKMVREFWNICKRKIMLKKRIIPKITVSSYQFGQTKKLAAITTKNLNVKGVGSPISQSRIYETGADQLLVINKDRLSISDDPLILELVKSIEDEISMPVCFGGGTDLYDCEKLFYAGIDKLSITSAAKNPSIIEEMSRTLVLKLFVYVSTTYLWMRQRGLIIMSI